LVERQSCVFFRFRYKAKFGFPFVICARENKKDAILRNIELRLENDRLTEINAGIAEVKKICSLRLLNIVDVEGNAKL
jgi:2-oxo-4-hydroxy-4-carboxy--5-ureidoimidazoline (OHCU) decarboxylase